MVDFKNMASGYSLTNLRGSVLQAPIVECSQSTHLFLLRKICDNTEDYFKTFNDINSKIAKIINNVIIEEVKEYNSEELSMIHKHEDLKNLSDLIDSLFEDEEKNEVADYQNLNSNTDKKFKLKGALQLEKDLAIKYNTLKSNLNTLLKNNANKEVGNDSVTEIIKRKNIKHYDHSLTYKPKLSMGQTNKSNAKKNYNFSSNIRGNHSRGSNTTGQYDDPFKKAENIDDFDEDIDFNRDNVSNTNNINKDGQEDIRSLLLVVNYYVLFLNNGRKSFPRYADVIEKLTKSYNEQLTNNNEINEITFKKDDIEDLQSCLDDISQKYSSEVISEMNLINNLIEEIKKLIEALEKDNDENYIEELDNKNSYGEQKQTNSNVTDKIEILWSYLDNCNLNSETNDKFDGILLNMINNKSFESYDKNPQMMSIRTNNERLFENEDKTNKNIQTIDDFQLLFLSSYRLISNKKISDKLKCSIFEFLSDKFDLINESSSSKRTEKLKQPANKFKKANTSVEKRSKRSVLPTGQLKPTKERFIVFINVSDCNVCENPFMKYFKKNQTPF